jgi:hypothetical protein
MPHFVGGTDLPMNLPWFGVNMVRSKSQSRGIIKHDNVAVWDLWAKKRFKASLKKFYGLKCVVA